MNTRLQQFLAAENISQTQFADSINVARASVSHILAGRNKPGFDFISSMILRYPSLNVDWLLTGRGKMYKSEMIAPVAVASRPLPADDDDLLFPDSETVYSGAHEQQIAAQTGAPSENFSLNTDINTLGKISQSIDNQKKAVKVIVFYNDGTFQEF